MADAKPRGSLGTVELLKFGSPTRQEPSSGAMTATTTPARLLNNNPNRVRWLVQNRGASRCFLWFNGTVSSTVGLVLEPDGGYVQALYEEDGEQLFNELWVVAAAGSVALIVDATEVRS